MTLRRQVMSGIVWTSLGQYSVQGLTLVTFFIMAKLLTPEEFGIAAIASTVVGVLTLVRGFGFGQALVYYEDDNEIAKTAFWFVNLMGLFFFALIFFSSPFIAEFYSIPLLEPLLKVLGLSIVFFALRLVPQSLLQKDLKFKHKQIPIIVSKLLYCVTSIGLAFAGFGVWAIVIASVLDSAILAFIYLVMSPFRPSFSLRIDHLRRLFGFGIFALANEVVISLYFMVDRLFLGRFLGMADVGYYQMASKFGYLTSTHMGGMLFEITFPVYSRLKHNIEIIRDFFLKTMKHSAMILFPSTVAIIVLGPVFLETVYGDKWHYAVTPLCIIAVAGLFRTLAIPAATVFYGIGRPDVEFYVKLGRLITVIFLLYPAAKLGGLIGVALLFSINQIIFAMIILTLTCRKLNINRIQMFDTIRVPLKATVIFVLMLAVIKVAVRTEPWNLVRFLVFSFVLAVLYIGILFVVDRKTAYLCYKFLRHPVGTFQEIVDK